VAEGQGVLRQACEALAGIYHPEGLPLMELCAWGEFPRVVRLAHRGPATGLNMVWTAGDDYEGLDLAGRDVALPGAGPYMQAPRPTGRILRLGSGSLLLLRRPAH
jgi:hypothetical protein